MYLEIALQWHITVQGNANFIKYITKKWKDDYESLFKDRGILW